MIYKNIFINKKEIKNVINIYKYFINKVGIKNLYYPFILNLNKGKLQKTIGLWNISVSLMKYKRGIHMSRIIFILNKLLLKPLNLKYFYNFYKIFVKNLESNDIFIQVCFLYFLKKISPLTNFKSLYNYKISFLLEKKNLLLNFFIKIVIVVNSLCPCSKLISFSNAHNQRCFISFFFIIKKKNIYINDFIKILENQSSSSLWSMLKRNDEKYITEFSYKNPKFIEDLIRNIYFRFKKKSFFLKIENLESIHNHDVYALLKKVK
ncbi:GTP cyclohydrolase, FolE2/MptA family [Candidatus Nasuia deltocephalinicola]|uniref:GTP cyclohydrolase, FolE2/MptA family n=1 Tax=Candidatus Nasuia deltocephalincola TaxID=1160784 RepID=UPI00216B2ED3|nr:GTP cyclohydrolase, FolE2/MptA family [Candidatus Nasuia deltocephalinicola]